MDGEKRTKTTQNIHFFFLNFYTIDIWTLSPERIADCLALEGKINYVACIFLVIYDKIVSKEITI